MELITIISVFRPGCSCCSHSLWRRKHTLESLGLVSILPDCLYQPGFTLHQNLSRKRYKVKKTASITEMATHKNGFLHLAIDLDCSVSHSGLFGYTNALVCENELPHFSEQCSFNLFLNINLGCHTLMSLATPWLLCK